MMRSFGYELGNSGNMFSVSSDFNLDGYNGTTPDFFLFPWDSFYLNASNVTTLDKDVIEDKLWKDIPLGILLIFLSLLTFVGNAMVLHAVRTERRLQTVSNMYIVSLAVADLIVGMFVMPMSTIYIFTEDWLFGVAVCQIWIAIDYTASTASILNLFILSVDRYWSVTSPLKYLRKRTKKRALMMISIVWAVSFFWIIPIVSWHEIAHGGIRTVDYNQCDTEYAHDSVFKVITAFFNFYLPLAIMYSLYGKVFHEIRKRSALELGQRYSRPTENMQFITVHESPTVENSSEHRVDSYSEEQHTLKSTEDNNYYSSIKYNCYNHVKTKKKKKNKRNKYGNVVRKTIKKTTKHTSYPPKCRVEYIYDESVLDPKTEKVERFYYQEHIPMTIRPREILISPPNMCNNEPSVSSSGTPVSTSSDEKRAVNFHKSKKDKHTYSLVSGLRQMRQTEHIIDHTVSVSEPSVAVAGNSKERTRSALLFTNSDHHRRMSTMLNIKHRIKNIRQSSLTKEIKAARQLGVIMGAFTLCFLPYFILFLVVAFCPDCIEASLMTAMTWIGYLNSTLNPFLYPLCNANFRRKFRRMLRLGKHQRRRHNIQTVERNSFTMRYD